jgi:hypothetical protein
MTTAKWTINTGVQQDFLPYPAARVNEKGCFAGVGVEMLKIFLLQPSGPGYKRSFIPPHIHTFVLFGTRSHQRQQSTYILGNPSLPFAIGTPLTLELNMDMYMYIYIYYYYFSFGTKVGIQTSQHHSRKSCPHSKVGRNYMNSFRKHSSTFAS